MHCASGTKLHYYLHIQIIIHTLQIIIYTLQIIIYTLQFIIYTLQIIIYTLQIITYTVVLSVQHIVFNVHSKLDRIYDAFGTDLHIMLLHIQYATYCIQFFIQNWT